MRKGVFGIPLTLEQIMGILFLFIVVVIIVIFIGNMLGNITLDSCWADVGKQMNKIEMRLRGPQIPIYEREEGKFTIEIGSCADSIAFVNHPIGREYRAMWSVCEVGESYIMAIPSVEDKTWLEQFTIDELKKKLKIKDPICESYSLEFNKEIKILPGRQYCIDIQPVKSDDERYFVELTEGACG